MGTFIDDLKSDVMAIGFDELREMTRDYEFQTSATSVPRLVLTTDYSVVFQDPMIPDKFKRFQCYEGEIFYLREIRQTPQNPLIFRMNPEGKIHDRLRRHSKGPGLSHPYRVAEFTMKLLNQERMSAKIFLEEVIETYLNWNDHARNTKNLYGGEMSGTW